MHLDLAIYCIINNILHISTVCKQGKIPHSDNNISLIIIITSHWTIKLKIAEIYKTNNNTNNKNGETYLVPPNKNKREPLTMPTWRRRGVGGLPWGFTRFHWLTFGSNVYKSLKCWSNKPL